MALGCLNLGLRHHFGTGVPKDLARAAALFQQACDGGVAMGCTNLGLLHDQGTGVPRDASRAAALHEKGCESGSAEACTRVGVRHFNGQGVTRDVTRGTFLLEKGCEGKDAQGCFILGQIAASRMRMGAQRRAEEYFEKACDFGSADACRKLGRPGNAGKR